MCRSISQSHPVFRSSERQSTICQTPAGYQFHFIHSPFIEDTIYPFSMKGFTHSLAESAALSSDSRPARCVGQQFRSRDTPPGRHVGTCYYKLFRFQRLWPQCCSSGAFGPGGCAQAACSGCRRWQFLVGRRGQTDPSVCRSQTCSCWRDRDQIAAPYVCGGQAQTRSTQK